MAFFLFLLVNATLFIRPAEIFPFLRGVELYFYLILACLLFAVLDVLRNVTEKSLVIQPITAMVFGIMLCIAISGVIAGDIAKAWASSYFFAKIVLYYLLLISLVNTSGRLRNLLLCMLISLATLSGIAVMNYHDIIQLATINPTADNIQGSYGEVEAIQRLQGSGMFGDPNELCVMLAAMAPLCLYFLTVDGNRFFRGLSAMILPVIGYAIYLTQSRGGLLALASGLGCLFWCRYGWKKAMLIGVIGVPLVLVTFGTRQTSISTSTHTARTRIDLWRDWFMVFRENMLTGNGMFVPEEEAEAASMGENRKLNRADLADTKLVAHNSYLQCFADLGLVGGCLFIGAFVTAVWSVYRLNMRKCRQINRDLRQLQPFVLACIVAYCLGMASLSLPYIIPTYLFLGLAVSYTCMAQRSAVGAPPLLRIDDARLLGCILAAGFCFLIGMYVFIRVFA